MSVVLRLVVDRRGRIISGDVVDLGNRVRKRFLNWRQLVTALRAHVVSVSGAQDNTASAPDDPTARPSSD